MSKALPGERRSRTYIAVRQCAVAAKDVVHPLQLYGVPVYSEDPEEPRESEEPYHCSVNGSHVLKHGTVRSDICRSSIAVLNSLEAVRATIKHSRRGREPSPLAGVGLELEEDTNEERNP